MECRSARKKYSEGTEGRAIGVRPRDTNPADRWKQRLIGEWLARTSRALNESTGLGVCGGNFRGHITLETVC